MNKRTNPPDIKPMNQSRKAESPKSGPLIWYQSAIRVMHAALARRRPGDGNRASGGAIEGVAARLFAHLCPDRDVAADDLLEGRTERREHIARPHDDAAHDTQRLRNVKVG